MHGLLGLVHCKGDGAEIFAFSSFSMSMNGYSGQGLDESSSMGRKEGDC